MNRQAIPWPRPVACPVAELIDLFGAADKVLDATLHETLSREALGLQVIERAADER